MEDFVLIDPHRARFIQQLRELIAIKQHILCDNSLSDDDKTNQIQNLAIPTNEGRQRPPIKLEDLGLTFQFSPSSKVFGFSAVDLRHGGELEVSFPYVTPNFNNLCFKNEGATFVNLLFMM